LSTVLLSSKKSVSWIEKIPSRNATPERFEFDDIGETDQRHVLNVAHYFAIVVVFVVTSEQ
jgi:hypothetical protein